MDLNPLLELTVEIADKAAALILEVYQENDFDVQIKSDNSPVTRADLLAHHLIVKKLREYDDSIPILSEESKATDWQQRQHWRKYWLVDPLDGTKEFVDRNGEFSVNIALIVEGKAILGVVHAPVSNQVYMAASGIGAFKRNNNADLQAISVRSVPIKDGQHQFTLVIGRGRIPEPLKMLYQGLPKQQIIRLGSALKTCLIAEGKADLYPRYGDTSEWDTAAAQCILECAGGVVSDMQFNALEYNSKESLLNPAFLAYGDMTVPWSTYLS